jgi:hypothetical protein
MHTPENFMCLQDDRIEAQNLDFAWAISATGSCGRIAA